MTLEEVFGGGGIYTPLAGMYVIVQGVVVHGASHNPSGIAALGSSPFSRNVTAALVPSGTLSGDTITIVESLV